jgi:dipeptidyl aminopeptidase/acylaminoacyl peptidase
LRCPIEQADCLWVALRLLRREVDYYRFPAESHELTRGGSPAHRRQRAELIIDWFGKRLLDPASVRERSIDLEHDPERVEDPIHH